MENIVYIIVIIFLIIIAFPAWYYYYQKISNFIKNAINEYKYVKKQSENTKMCSNCGSVVYNNPDMDECMCVRCDCGFSEEEYDKLELYYKVNNINVVKLWLKSLNK